jgi:hypothetical protein
MSSDWLLRAALMIPAGIFLCLGFFFNVMALAKALAPELNIISEKEHKLHIKLTIIFSILAYVLLGIYFILGFK